MLTVTYAECHIQAPYAEWLYAECRYAEYRYAECHGAFKTIEIRSFKISKFNKDEWDLCGFHFNFVGKKQN
jgi:hypothetical protein